MKRMAFPFVSNVVYTDSIRYLIRESTGLTHNDDDAIAWCLNGFKKHESYIIEQFPKRPKESSIPDIEVYVDRLIDYIVYAFNKKGMYRISQDSMELFHDVFIMALSEVLIHELLHFYSVADEDVVDEVIKEVHDYLNGELNGNLV